MSLWLTSAVSAFIYITLPKRNDIVPTIILFVALLLATATYISIYKVVGHHQNQIQSQLQMQNAQAVELLREKKSAYNAFFMYLVFLACYFPFHTSQILYVINSLRISYLMARQVTLFKVLFNFSLNSLVYCWRYREIRQIMKSTMKKIFRMNEEKT